MSCISLLNIFMHGKNYSCTDSNELHEWQRIWRKQEKFCRYTANEHELTNLSDSTTVSTLWKNKMIKKSLVFSTCKVIALKKTKTACTCTRWWHDSIDEMLLTAKETTCMFFSYFYVLMVNEENKNILDPFQKKQWHTK